MAYKFSFEKLDVWHISIDLAERIYTLTSSFPEEEKYGLVSQMRRAAVSVSSNLAEGSSRTYPKDQARFYQIAYSSLMELTSQLYLSQKISFLKSGELENLKNLILELSNKINNLRKSLLNRIKEPGTPYGDNNTEGNDFFTIEAEEQYSTPQQLNTSTSQHLNTSTPQQLNISTPQHLNNSTPQHLNTSTPQQFTDSPINQLLQKDGYLYHPTATIDPGANIGANTRIWHYSHIMSGAEIGAECNLGQNVFVATGGKIGRGVKVQNNVSLYAGVCCEDDVFIGPSVVFTNVINPRSGVVRKAEYQPTTVGQGASIGANATIICGLHIGAHAFVAAGATVTKEVLPYALVRGNPARQTGWISEYGYKLAFNEYGNAACPESGEVYQLINQSVQKVSQCA